MEYRYTHLADGLGFAIFLEMEVITDFSITAAKAIFPDLLFIQLANFSILQKEVEYWVSLAIKDMASRLVVKISDKTCFYVKYIDINHAHFQEEGIYLAAIGWICKMYDLPFHRPEIEYDKRQMKFKFKGLRYTEGVGN